jgi:ribose/xylose/arabinose/galactoside ABC-type transport system permease subunit
MAGNKHSWFNFLRKYGTVLGAALIFIIFSIVAENFLTGKNLLILLRQMSALTIISLGFTFVMAGGGFDMSIGNAAGLVNIMFGIVLFQTNDLLLSLLTGLAVGVAVGVVNGWLVSYVGLPDFIGTFAVGSIVYGVKMMISQGNPVFFRDDVVPAAKYIGQGYVGDIPFPVILMVIFVLIAIFVLGKTTLGRRIYAIGGNKVASLYSGINVKKFRMISFIIGGLAVGIAAIVTTSRLGSAQPLAGEDFLLDAIAVVFLSTTMFGEGEPTAAGTFFGALIITMLNYGLTMLNLEYYFQNITKGLVVILAVLISVTLRKKTMTKI